MFTHIVRWFKGGSQNEDWPAVDRRKGKTERRRRSDLRTAVTVASAQPPGNVANPQVATVRQAPARNGTARAVRPPHNPVIRNRYVREDTGTHETLTILDESLLDTPDDGGIDPYNSGEFDRARNWERNFRG